MYLFEGINALLELNVIRWELRLDTMVQLRRHNPHELLTPWGKAYLVISSAQLLFDILLSPSCKRRE